MANDNAIEEIDENNAELDWETNQKTIIKIAEQNIGVLKRPKMLSITVDVKKLSNNAKKQEN
ncbi:Hypothetical protein CINCED_3A001175 [Cinara cedri]|uniref:Uncharacterized protein n=1 Tax=Cinara cedri TaxID=506608 RepID=A0A5E4MU32_9HEMI|nr:Hypothetical protein CINCED_3A001175 [Cinara cedri]